MGQEQLPWVPSSLRSLVGMSARAPEGLAGGRGSIFRMAQSHGIGWSIDPLPRGLSVAPWVSSCHSHWLPSEQDEGGVWEEEAKAAVSLWTAAPLHFHTVPLAILISPCNVTETTERQRSEHQRKPTEAHLGASCPVTMEGFLPHCPLSLPRKTGRYIRQRLSLVSKHRSATELDGLEYSTNLHQLCKENWATSFNFITNIRSHGKCPDLQSH